jgi:hypothetical protein
MELDDKFEIWKLSITEGRKQADKLGLDKFENWTPLYLWIYGVGVFGGCLGSFVFGLFFVLLFVRFLH